MRGRRFWHPLHTQKPYQTSGHRLPHSVKQIPRAMWLPSAFTLSDAQVRTVCEEIRGFLEEVPAGIARKKQPLNA